MPATLVAKNPMQMSANEVSSMATAYVGTDASQGLGAQSSGVKWAMWSASGVTTMGTINVNTLYAPGRLKCTTEEINRYKWDILGVSETYWCGEEME